MKKLLCGVSVLLAVVYGSAFASQAHKAAYASDSYSVQLVDDTSSDASDSDDAAANGSDAAADDASDSE